MNKQAKVWDKTWKYVPSHETNIRRTIQRELERMRLQNILTPFDREEMDAQDYLESKQ